MCALLFQVLDSNGITHMCRHTATVRLIAARLSAKQGQILLLSADLHQYAGDTNLKRERLAGKKKDQPETCFSSLLSFHVSHVRCHRGSLREGPLLSTAGRCCILGVKMRRHFVFGDLLLSSCYICQAHRYSQPSPPLQLSVHFFSLVLELYFAEEIIIIKTHKVTL